MTTFEFTEKIRFSFLNFINQIDKSHLDYGNLLEPSYEEEHNGSDQIAFNNFKIFMIKTRFLIVAALMRI